MFFSHTLLAPTLAIIRWRNGAVVRADTKCSFLLSDTIARGNIKRNKSVDRQKVVHRWKKKQFCFAAFFIFAISPLFFADAIRGVEVSQWTFLLHIINFVLLPNMLTSINENHWIEQKGKYFHLKLYFFLLSIRIWKIESFIFPHPIHVMPKHIIVMHDKREIG